MIEIHAYELFVTIKVFRHDIQPQTNISQQQKQTLHHLIEKTQIGLKHIIRVVCYNYLMQTC